MLDKSESEENLKSVLRGVFTKSDDNLLEVVTNIVNAWNDPNIKPEFIIDVQKGMSYSKGEGKHNLFVTAIDEQSSCALIAAAKQHFSPSDGITWSPFSKTRVCQSFIEGLTLKSDQNLTEIVKQMVTEWNDSEVEPNIIENVINSEIDGKAVLVVTATTPQNSRLLVKCAKRHLTEDSVIKWYFTRRFETH